jgi:hypothetical protein
LPCLSDCSVTELANRAASGRLSLTSKNTKFPSLEWPRQQSTGLADQPQTGRNQAENSSFLKVSEH